MTITFIVSSCYDYFRAGAGKLEAFVGRHLDTIVVLRTLGLLRVGRVYPSIYGGFSVISSLLRVGLVGKQGIHKMQDLGLRVEGKGIQ